MAEERLISMFLLKACDLAELKTGTKGASRRYLARRGDAGRR